MQGLSRILLVEDDRKTYLKKMRNPKADVAMKNALMTKIRDRCKLSICPWCGSKNGVVKKTKSSLAIAHDFSRTIDGSKDEVIAAMSHISSKSLHIAHLLSPIIVLSLFKKMLDEDCELLNMSDRPEKFIVTNIAIPTVSIRPSAFVDAGASSNEDSITIILKGIISTNSVLREDLEGVVPPFKCLGLHTRQQLRTA
ncbi:DNA-directed RNA polymerase III subunit 1-like isoform X1 [Zingiber officinale]|uniref:DNA-directed RNA polymerase III subunit 1-like isoform X1 n=1 Tax=Zingiber officinale TaxID=94328 RepID=UPI001C4D8A31|nr:DNA-directed RNA polymerase III subunit 1-like isoform X1 [Zingiber officinale]